MKKRTWDIRDWDCLVVYFYEIFSNIFLYIYSSLYHGKKCKKDFGNVSCFELFGCQKNK
jgi:hypothetical protein